MLHAYWEGLQCGDSCRVLGWASVLCVDKYASPSLRGDLGEGTAEAEGFGKVQGQLYLGVYDRSY